ncbi:hypothetical protein ABEB36_000419 [Hypothenemus hampei]|uniref:Adhesion G protein-coupled receptor A3 n=1 Tax=Hypothenemus hampei TaxID=57062 RepID=A0ABD1FB46_HYPHA
MEESLCPHNCICKLNARNEGNYLKMTCGEPEKVSHLDELELLNIATYLVQLNLSNNNLKNFRPKVELIALQKLNISGNQLVSLEANQFMEVPKLKRLDLSYNRIKHIDSKAFSGLKELERLKLNHNEITTITFGTLDALPKLKQLDISNDPLQCDCGLLWILDYSEKHLLKLMSNPKCSSAFEGTLLKKLKVGVDIHCKSATQDNILPLIDMQPANNQVVFEGDSLKLVCKAPSLTDSINGSSLEWLWLGYKPQDHFVDVSIVENFLPNPGIISSNLYIKKLTRSHEGMWTCLFSSFQGNHSKNITILVISDTTKYCPVTTIKGNKGTYTFPRTIANHTVNLPCEFKNDYYETSHQTVSYFCSENRTWHQLNTTRCVYLSDTTRILEGFSKVNTSILESAKHLKEYTANTTTSMYKDVIDLMFTITSVENYARLQPSNAMSNILIDVVSNLIHLPKDFWQNCSQEYDSGPKVLNILENMAVSNAATLFERENLVIEAFPIGKGNFPGIKCSWFQNDINRLDTLFSCSTNNNIPDSVTFQRKIIESSVIVPSSVLPQNKNNVDAETTNNYSIIVSTFRTSNIFPMENDLHEAIQVASAVVGVRIAGFSQVDLSHPITVIIRVPRTTLYEGTPFIPVYWDQTLDKWTNQGCQFGYHWQEHVVFTCKKLGYYGLSQVVPYSNNTKANMNLFRLSQPAICVGNVIIFLSLLIAILTYTFGFSSIQMPKKAKHCLINTWAAISLLCFLYSFGIYQTEDQRLCQIIGLSLHYLTLCSLLWMCVTLNSMYKRLSRNGDSILQDDELPSEQPIKKPLMGLYLVGWGIALIVCGLSAAINIREYASYSHCFLRIGPALSALYVPTTILFIFMFVLFLMVRCAINNLDLSHGGHLSEDSVQGTQATEHVDLDLLEPSFPQQQPDIRSVRSYSSKTASSEIADNERSPLAQLKAHLIFVLLFVFAWITCAFATVPPFGGVVSYEAELFSGAFAVCGATLSAFTLFFYCIARNDVRTQWMLLFRRMRGKRLLRPRMVSDTAPVVQVQALGLPPISNSEAQAMSRSSSRSSARTKTNSLKGATAYDLNGSLSDRPSNISGTKINNVNLITLHRAQYRPNVVPHIIENPTNAAEAFYNPHQSTVARKFFRKQRRDMMKRNNLQPKPPRDVNSDVTSVFSEHRPIKTRNMEQNIFGTNSKVNNTNIHVEHVRKSQRTNPNIFFDSRDDLKCQREVPVEKLVINAERLRKKELGRNKARKKSNNIGPQGNFHSTTQMRTVSQQCTLDYSSDNPLSDSILDKNEESHSIAIVPINTSGNVETTTHLCNKNEDKIVNEPTHYSLEESEISDSGIKNKNSPLMRLRSPSNFFRASSASATDIDELYQQIRRGPLPLKAQPQRAYSSPFLSDSDITGIMATHGSSERLYEDEDLNSIDIETTV